MSPEERDAALAAHDGWQIRLHATVRGIAMAAHPDMESGGLRAVLSNDDFDALNQLFVPPGLDTEMAARFRPEAEVIGVAWENLTVVRFDPLPGGSPTCRECGCWDQRACHGGCSWVEPDLCSSCAGQRQDEIAYRDRPTRPARFSQGEAVEILVARLPDGSDRVLALRGRPSEWIQQNWHDSDSAAAIGLPQEPGLYLFQGTWEQIECNDWYSEGIEREDSWLGTCRTAIPEDLYLLNDDAEPPVDGEISVGGVA